MAAPMRPCLAAHFWPTPICPSVFAQGPSLTCRTRTLSTHRAPRAISITRPCTRHKAPEDTAMTTIARLQRMNLGSQFRAFTLRGDQFAKPIDPFLGVDHAWTSGPTFAPHPHAGFSAVSYLFMDSETGIDNRDSLGNRNLIQPGGLHWTAAGSGVVHEEVPAEPGKTVHMLQMFINLPVDRQAAAPFALSLAAQDVPVVHLPGVKVRVPLGRFAEVASPLSVPSEVCVLDISIEDGAQVSIPIADGHVAFVMPIDGEVL